MESNFKFYDKNKIGSLIAWAGDHRVYNYGPNQVIKFSLIEKLFGDNGRIKTEKDYSVCKKFFGKYILDSELVTLPNGNGIATIQTKILGRYLFKNDLANPEVAGQFLEIMHGYQALISAGYPQIDLIGRGGVFKNCLSNIFITPDRRLVIIDASLLEFKEAGIFFLPFFIILKLAIWRNNNVIKFFMKIYANA